MFKMWPDQCKGTKFAQNGKYLELCVQYLLSVSFKTSLIKVLNDGKTLSSVASANIYCGLDITNLKNVVKFYVPTWSIFAGPITNINTNSM